MASGCPHSSGIRSSLSQNVQSSQITFSLRHTGSMLSHLACHYSSDTILIKISAGLDRVEQAQRRRIGSARLRLRKRPESYEVFNSSLEYRLPESQLVLSFIIPSNTCDQYCKGEFFISILLQILIRHCLYQSAYTFIPTGYPPQFEICISHD